MKCENLQFNLSIYMDNHLTGDERALVDEHLARCPVCRQKLADFQELRRDLRVLARPEIPNYVLNSVRSAVASELRTNETAPLFLFESDSRGWLKSFLMPYSVGIVTSLFLGFVVLGVLLSGANIEPQSVEIASTSPAFNRTVMLTHPKTNDFPFDANDIALSPKDFANARLSVSGESPSVNPTGALVALTKSLVRGEMKDEEVVVVADVFGNGLAQIAEVIEPPRDTQTLYNLDKALKTDPDFAPFVPASFDNRADSIQIVLKIQRVDVNFNKLKPQKRK
jgi:Putative zinc-finger